MIKLNGFVVVPTKFPDGTSQVWKLSSIDPQHNVVLWEFEGEHEVAHIIQLGMLLPGVVELHAPFLPYGRQDKDIENDSCFALYMIADIVDAYYDKLVTFDCHNPQFFDQVAFDFESIDPFKEISFAAESVDASVFCYPDAGAAMRYDYDFGQKKIVFGKDRDQATGKINGVFVEHDCVRSGDDVVLIVDDICDGGWTFTEVAKHLGWAKQVNLYVSHGIFSKGTEVLRDAGISRIFTRNGEVK